MDVTIDILLAAQKGDVGAQQILMESLYTPVFHFVLKRTGSKDVADELSQTVFLKCYERLDTFNENVGTVYTWVFTIARNTLIDHFRKKQPDIVEDLSDLPASDQTSNPETMATARIDSTYVAQLLSTLPAEDADIITLRAINEMSYEKIAAITQKSEPAVRKAYSRAIQRLKIHVSQSSRLAYE